MPRNLSAFVMSVTPFDDERRLDEEAFRAHLRRIARSQVSVYVAGSGSGEANTLSFEERDRVLAIAAEELKGKRQVRAMGCEPHLTSEMVQFVERAEHFGLDAVHVYSLDIGHGAIPTRPEMERYYATVLDSTSLPVVISSHRAAGYVLPLDLVETLVNRYESIVGIAYGGSDVSYLAELVSRYSDRLEVHCSGVKQAATTLALGGHGFMGHEGNLSPELPASVIAAFAAGDQAALQSSYRKLLALNAISDRYGGSTVRAIKPLLNLLGLPGGQLRSPRLAISRDELGRIAGELAALDLPDLPQLDRFSFKS